MTYQFGDVVAALNQVHAYDWAAFLRSRLDGHGPRAPLDGLARGGCKLVFSDTPTELITERESLRKSVYLDFSIGFDLGREAVRRRRAQGGHP